ncbi:MAG: hypothetical protein HRT77_06005 [Halioglobus sp.]|nr:hypothetical protein [Halioglobus sp.]
MQIAILILASVLGLLVLFRLLYAGTQQGGARAGRERRTGFADGNPFHAVSILTADGHCAAVGSLKVQRFLSDEAPGLPLEACAVEDCQCRYLHHADRRSGARDRRLRLADDASARDVWHQRERRVSRGRRQEDLQPA